MAKNSTRYLILALFIVAVFVLSLLLLKSCQTTNQQPEASKPVSQQESNRPGVQENADQLLADYLPRSKNKQIVAHSHYTLSYREEHEQAEWVAYELTRDEVKGVEARSDDFREDPKVETGSATLADYYRSGYDRGHLAPAGDMKFSETAMSESFYMSNISPQKPEFNRGIWRELEEEVRELAQENGNLYVVTGPVFFKRSRRIGDNRVSIPQAYYKILLDYKQPEIKAIAFLLPNEGSDGELYQFIVPIDKVEELTDIDFFPGLPDDEEAMLEQQVNANMWGVDY